jgi:WD40 repeat protein
VNAAMSTAQTAGKFYVAGGTLCTDAASYIVREADERLFQSLQEGNFSYVLTSRQMGKSSLMVRTATRLKADGVGVSIADLSAIGQNLSADQWYYGLAERIGGQYGFQDARIEEIWSRNPHYPPVRRWMSFVDELLRDNTQDRLVIFIDEIDTVRSLSFSTDEFFASIRSFYNGRTVQTEYRRLTFCLLGVAAPAELIRNPLTTPFNIGTRIELNDFTEAEASPLAAGLGGGEGDTKRLCRVLRWTRGHPYLTQRLCQALATARDSNSVDEICGSTFLGSRASASDENLAFVRDYLLHIDVDTAALLKVYQRIRLGRRIADSETDPSITALRLSGICQARDGHLQVRNPIYAHVFDRRWVRASMPDAERRRQRAAFQRGFVLASLVGALVIAVIGFLTYDVSQERNQNRWRLYIANVSLAGQAWQGHDPVRAIELLASVTPRRSERDLRGLEWYALWNLTHAEHPLVSIRAGALRYPILSADGRRIFAVGPDSVAELDSQTGSLVRTVLSLPHNAYPVPSISSDGRTLGLKSPAKLITIDLATGGVSKGPAPGSRESPPPAEFMARSDPLVSGGCPWIIFLHDSTWKGLLKQREDESIRCTSLSPDQQYLAVATRTHVDVWSATLPARIASIPTDQPATVAFSNDSHYLAWADYDAIHVFDIRTKQVSTLPGHRRGVGAVAFSPDGEWLASAGQDDVQIWDLRFGREVRSFGRYAGIPAVAFFSDGRKLLIGGTATIDIWDLRQRLPDMEEPDELYTLAFSPDGAIMASGGNADQLTLWDTTTHVRKRAFQIGERVDFLSFLDVHSMVVNTVHHVAIWNLASGRSESLLAESKSRLFAALAPDRKTIAIADVATRELKLVDLATRRVQDRRQLNGVPGALAFAPDSHTLAVSLTDERVEVVDGSNVHQLRGSGFGRSLAFSPSGAQLLVGYDEAQICAWDWRRQRIVATLEGHTAPIKSIRFSPDGTRLVSASDDGTVRIWDAATYEEIVAFRDSERDMETIAFSPDSRFLAAAGDDHRIRLWDALRVR